MKKTVSLILAAVLAVLMFSCKSEDKKENPGKEQTGEALQNGGSITIYSLKDDTLCPILTDNDANRNMLCIVYESLISLNDKMEPKGVLATKWSASDDNLCWTVHIRNGVKWHSGDDFSAQDVVYTVNQIKKNADSSYFYNTERITSVSAEGDRVIFKLKSPCSNFPNLLTFPIIKNNTHDIDRTYFVPCGTGAYTFSDKNEGNMYYLLKNENWWGKDKANIDEIKVRLLPDSETVMYSFSAGDIDVADTPIGNWGRFVSRSKTRSSSCPSTVYDFLGINHKNKALSKTEVRKALSKAISRRDIVGDIFAGDAEAVNSPIRKDWFMSSGKTVQDAADSEGAEKILTSNEWKKNGDVYRKKIGSSYVNLKFNLIVNEENANQMNMAERVRLDAERAGYAITVIPLSYEEYLNRISSGKYDLFIGSVMLSAELDYSFFLGTGNMFGFEDEKMNDILTKIANADGKKEIKSAYSLIDARFKATVPIVGLCFENFNMIYNGRVHGNLKSVQGNIYNGIYSLSLKAD